MENITALIEIVADEDESISSLQRDALRTEAIELDTLNGIASNQIEPSTEFSEWVDEVRQRVILILTARSSIDPPK